MGDKSGIEWTDATWNPVVGCSVLSAGCKNCYAMRMAGRLEKMGGRTGEKYAGLTQASKAGPVWNGEVRLDIAALGQPMRWKKPRRIFVNSMSDIGHPGLGLSAAADVFAAMAAAPHHSYQLLTKRPEHLRDLLRNDEFQWNVECRIDLYDDLAQELGLVDVHARMSDDWRAEVSGEFPMPGVIIGASVEDQASADARRDALAAIAAAGWRTFVSYEPALGPVGWSGWEFLAGMISGGESGSGARPSHPDWHRAARDFAARHGIPFCFKQWGDWAPYNFDEGRGDWFILFADGILDIPDDCAPDQSRGEVAVRRAGKKAAGRLLDGIVHDGRIE